MDFVKAKLKQFEKVIEQLPSRLKAPKDEDETAYAISDLFEFSLNEAKNLLNEFMGFACQIYRARNGNFTPEEAESILMIDVSLHLYFEDNIIPKKSNASNNYNTKTDAQQMAQLIDGVSHAFGLSSDSDYAYNVQEEYTAIRKSLPNFSAYEEVYDRLMDIRYEIIKNPSNEIMRLIRGLSQDEESSSSPSSIYPNIKVSLPKPPPPKKP